MNITQAIEILEEYRSEIGTVHMLETLQYIQQNYEDTDRRVQVAFNLFMRIGKKLFLPVEEV